jgi:hypothetical protein
MLTYRPVLAVASIVVLVAAVRALAGSLITEGEFSNLVALEDVRVSDGVVSGVLVNKSDRFILRDIRLLIRHSWLWDNERAPARDNPGRTDSYAVPGEIRPNERLSFNYKIEPPLPKRSDGHFETSVQVVSLTQVG